jgi:hypothetical protein
MPEPHTMESEATFQPLQLSCCESAVQGTLLGRGPNSQAPGPPPVTGNETVQKPSG